jgi:phage terminase large subunit
MLVDSFQGMGRKLEILPRGDKMAGIEAVRQTLPITYFDRQKCEEGLKCLRNYRYGIVDRLSTGDQKAYTREPVHDWASHGADAFRTMAVATKRQVKKPVSSVTPMDMALRGLR